MVDTTSLLFVHNGKGLGGSPKALRYIIEVCKKQGYSCHVACVACDETIPYFREAGAEIITLTSLPRYSNSTTCSFDLNSRKYKREREVAAQYASYWRRIIHDYGPFSLVFLNSMVLCDLIKTSRASGCKVIQTVRETVQTGPSLLIMKDMFGEANAVLFISEYDSDVFSIESVKNIVIPDSVDPSLYSCGPDERLALRKAHGLGPEDVVLLFTGGVEYIKGGEFLLESLKRVNCPKSITVFFAGYSCDQDIKYRCKELLSRISNSRRFVAERTTKKLSLMVGNRHMNIRPIGFCTNIHDYFKMSDICLIPYKVPHQAMPIFEAGMAKLPCIISDFPCYHYEVKDGDNGYVLPIDNPYVWARKIESLVTDKQQRIQMGLRNYQMAMKRHDIYSNTQDLLRFINSVLTAVQ